MPHLENALPPVRSIVQVNVRGYYESNAGRPATTANFSTVIEVLDSARSVSPQLQEFSTVQTFLSSVISVTSGTIPSLSRNPSRFRSALQSVVTPSDATHNFSLVPPFTALVAFAPKSSAVTAGLLFCVDSYLWLLLFS